jgi:cytochrome c oxidase assembly protein subunit 15
MVHDWLHRFTVVVALFTLLLVIAGGLVTSNDAAGSIPDWPLSWGKLIPPLEGGIRYEFAHRALAASVAVMTLALALWSRRRLAWLAFATVVAQALLGGAAVRLVEPKALVIAHACLAQICFGLVVAQLFELPYWGGWERRGPAIPMAVAALFAQTILGAAVRHQIVGVIPHIGGAAVATVIVMWAGLGVLMQHMENSRLRRAAMVMLSLTFSQVFLGMGAYLSRVATADAPQPMPMMVWFTVAHVAIGTLAFGSAIILALVVYWHPSDSETVHGGMAVA